MRLVSLIAILMLTVACGKEGGGSGSSVADKSSECSLNGRSVACASIQGADGLGVDLLETMIDVPVQIANTDITFMADKTSTDQGRRLSCKTSVKNGETYRYALRGNKLIVMTSAGTYEMDRLTDGDSLLGTWVWKGYEDSGAHIIRQMSFLSNTRLIMRTNCEL